MTNPTGGSFQEQFSLLDYIEGTGTQWIDTGFCATGGCITDFEFAPTNYNDNVTVGSHNPRNNSANSFNRNQVAFTSSTQVQWSKCSSYGRVAFNSQLRTKYHIRFNTIGQNRIGSIDGTTYANQTSGTGTLNPVNTVTFLHSWYDDTNNKGILYSLKIYDSTETLVRDFIPVVRNSDGKPGLYDLCGSICPLTNTQFYINAGTGEFTYA